MQYQLPLKRQQSLALWRVSDSLLQRADYLYAYNHRRFTTTDNGNEHTTRPLSSGNSTSVVSVEPRVGVGAIRACLLYTSPSPRDRLVSRMPSSA